MPHAPQEIRTFFVTSTTKDRRSIFQTERIARLFMDVLQDNRKKGRFQLHEFVLMPDHFHVLITPAETVPVEKAVQYIKGGFSFRAKRELNYNAEIWQDSFGEHRIKDSSDYESHRTYIHEIQSRDSSSTNPRSIPIHRRRPEPTWTLGPRGSHAIPRAKAHKI